MLRWVSPLFFEVPRFRNRGSTFPGKCLQPKMLLYSSCIIMMQLCEISWTGLRGNKLQAYRLSIVNSSLDTSALDLYRVQLFLSMYVRRTPWSASLILSEAFCCNKVKWKLEVQLTGSNVLKNTHSWSVAVMEQWLLCYLQWLPLCAPLLIWTFIPYLCSFVAFSV